MKIKDIVIGSTYLCKVSGQIVPLLVQAYNESEDYKGRTQRTWTCKNLKTEREIVVRSALRFRSRVVTRS